MKNEKIIDVFLSELSEINKGIFDGTQGSPKVKWWEEEIFNEEVLYEALGKENARSVLAIWERYKKTILIVRLIEKTLKDEI